MKKKRSPLKDLLFVSISSFIVVVAWVGFNIYHTWVTTTITPEMQVTITAIHPDFDAATIQKLKARKQVVPVTSLSGKVAPTGAAGPVYLLEVPSGTPEPSEASLPSSSPSPSAVPETGTETGTGAQILPQPQVSNIPVTVNGE